MRLLLDTHAFLWFIIRDAIGDARFSTTARALVEDSANTSSISVASIWEMAIKVSIGKLTFRQPFTTLLPQQLERNGIVLLGITIDHALAVTALPFHHRDPFDRLLIAQAMTEQLPLVSADVVFDSYAVTRLW